MKKTLVVLLLAFSMSVHAQDKQPKLRITQGFFTTKYELGDKYATAKEVRSHLEQHGTESYYLWRKSESAEMTALFGNLVGVAGVIYGVSTKENSQMIVGYTIGLGGFTTALICDIVSKARLEKAANIYNKKYSY